jgi:hypothetical protein
MLFDALIGNSDRHQENWAFITRSTVLTTALDTVEKEVKDKGFGRVSRFLRWGYGCMFNREKGDLNEDGKIIHLRSQNVVKMAPIYDSGSSMGRELNDERISRYLSNAEEFNIYVDNGKSELHWGKNKISHLLITENLLGSAYIEQLLTAATFLQDFKEQYAEMLVHSIDKQVPPAYRNFCLTGDRKKFITKLLCLRARKLKGIIDNGRV